MVGLGLPFLFVIVVDVFSRLLSHAASRNFIKGFDVGNNYIDIHHLQFAHDTILFSTFEDRSLTNMFNLVRLFEEASVLTINHQKSEIWGLI